MKARILINDKPTHSVLCKEFMLLLLWVSLYVRFHMNVCKWFVQVLLLMIDTHICVCSF